jgi:hypothetical protein
VEDLSCRKCGRAGWKNDWARLGHQGRCRGVPGLIEKVSQIQAAPLPAAPSRSRSGSTGAAPAAPSGASWAPPPASPPLQDGTARLLEGRISILEEENTLLKQVVLNDLKHLDQAAQAAPSPLPWIALGGAAVLAGLWIAGFFDAAEEGGPEGAVALGDVQRRPPSAVGAVIGKLVDRVAGKVIDRAIGKIF